MFCNASGKIEWCIFLPARGQQSALQSKEEVFDINQLPSRLINNLFIFIVLMNI